MTERLPYEEQMIDLLDTIPLPDENMAWADMKLRLEEDRPLLPFWLRGCAGWGLLGIVLLGLGWWIVRPEKWFMSKKQEPKQEQVQPINNTGKDTKDTLNYAGDSLPPIAVTGKKDTITLKENENSSDTISVINSTGKISKTKKEKDQKADADNAIIKKGGKKKVKKTTPVVSKGKPAKVTKPNNDGNEGADTTTSIGNPKPVSTDSVTINKIIKPEPTADSAKTSKKNTTAKKIEEVKPSVAKKDSTKKKSFSFSAGIALHQQLPVAGQTFVPYNSLGRKGSLLDYIPSVYARLNRDDKWFVQIGFRYGAPQLVNKLLYNSRADTVSPQKYNTTSTYLKKTFYHQLPISFNYFVAKNFSIGGEIVWNKFSGAVSSRDIVQVDRFTGNDTILSSNEILNFKKADSFFQKSYWQASIEAQYKWKRFSIGANYSFGLQPYIKFVLPGGAAQEEKNKSLQLFIRYELWRSKK